MNRKRDLGPVSFLQELDGPCNSCGLERVQWRRAPRGRYLLHAGGRNSCRFPCRSGCDHLDCAAARAELANELELEALESFNRAFVEAFGGGQGR